MKFRAQTVNRDSLTVAIAISSCFFLIFFSSVRGRGRGSIPGEGESVGVVFRGGGRGVGSVSGKGWRFQGVPGHCGGRPRGLGGEVVVVVEDKLVEVMVEEKGVELKGPLDGEGRQRW
ncbi:hypothetical protein LIER_06354 [Lithospermum erythrorhizon]|uniref:Transmembrane protein n=1 Tax=Lithospermum erythrorhizon TaxID=34254 RepID=A0AAV3P485_LITER